MKKRLLILLFLPLGMFAQDMSNETLQEIYTTVSDSINGKLGGWRFFINQVPLMSLTDTSHNRMRIMSPIMASKDVSDDLVKAALVANFHTALDVKYAVSDGILWSVFIHPLKELTAHQVKDAVSQVYHANKNFGTTFASTSLSFPGKLSRQETDTKEIPTNKETPTFKKL